MFCGDIKPYDLALYIGRFQPLHIGHVSAIETALTMCDRVLVLVGSAQESGTIRNPFDVETRMSLIKEIFGNRVIVKPLNDLTNEDDVSAEWGNYLMDNVKRLMGKTPDIMVYGDEDCDGWFAKEDMTMIRIVMPRARRPISATQIREFLVKNDREGFFVNTHPKEHKHYDVLRGELFTAKPYAIAFNNLIRQNKELKGWSDYDVKDKKLEGDLDFQDQDWA